MQTKLFEVRDRGTCIPVMATKTTANNVNEQQFLTHGGWGDYTVILTRMDGQAVANIDPYFWRREYNGRTLTHAHAYIINNFDILPTYAVIDVEYILGESKTPKQSEVWK